MDKVGFSDLRPEVEFGVLGRATLMEVRVRNSGVPVSATARSWAW